MILLYWLRGIFGGFTAGATIEIFRARPRARIFFTKDRPVYETREESQIFDTTHKDLIFKSDE